MRELEKNTRRGIRNRCLVLAAVAALALPGASWLDRTPSSAERDTASWVNSASEDGAA
jgi:hypothetical protein